MVAGLLGFGQDMAANIPATSRAVYMAMLQLAGVLAGTLGLVVGLGMPDPVVRNPQVATAALELDGTRVCMDVDGERVSCCALAPVHPSVALGYMALVALAGLWLIGVIHARFELTMARAVELYCEQPTRAVTGGNSLVRKAAAATRGGSLAATVVAGGSFALQLVLAVVGMLVVQQYTRR